MDKIIGLKDLREHMGHYATKVEKGESFVVVRKSKPLFRITSVDTEDMWETVIDFTKIQKGGVDIKDVLARMK